MTSREWARRTHSHVSRNDQDIYNLVQVLRGSISLRHGAHEFRLGPQSFALFCVTRPYEWDHADVAEVRNFALPGSLLRARLRDLDRFTNRAFQQPNGSWAVLFDMIGSSFRHADNVPDPAAHRIASQLVDLLTLSLEVGDELSLGTPENRYAAYLCCVNVIRSNISDRDLGPNSVAKAAGVSVRSLHRLFAEHGSTVCDLIREERLSACFKALQDPSLDHFHRGDRIPPRVSQAGAFRKRLQGQIRRHCQGLPPNHPAYDRKLNGARPQAGGARPGPRQICYRGDCLR